MDRTLLRIDVGGADSAVSPKDGFYGWLGENQNKTPLPFDTSRVDSFMLTPTADPLPGTDFLSLAYFIVDR